MLTQIIDDGVFHSDLHPGNIIVADTGELVLLDYGAVGRLDSATRERIRDVLLAFSRGHSQQFTEAMLEFVTLSDDVDEPALRRAIAAFVAHRLGPGSTLDVEVFSEMLQLLTAHRVSVPGELAPQAIFRSLTDEAQQLLPTLRSIPGRLDASLAAIASGRLKMNVRLFADARDRSLITGLVNLAALAFLAGATGVMAVLLLVSEAGPRITDTMTLFQIFGYMLVVLSGLLTLRVLFETLRFRCRDSGIPAIG